MGQGNDVDSVSDFIDFLRQHNIGPLDSGDIIANDKKNRYTLDTDRPRTKNGTYRLGIVDNIMMGWARSHKDGQTHNFISKSWKRLTPEQQAALKAQVEQRRKDTAERLHRQHDETAAFVQNLLRSAHPANPKHLYLQKKQIGPGGFLQLAKDTLWKEQKISAGDLLLPLTDINGKIWNLQTISARGFKMYLDGGRKRACFSAIGEARPFCNDPYVICEGRATGATIHMATGWPVRCAMDTSNLLPVGAALRWKYNYALFIYAADNDAWTTKPGGAPWNPGLEYARSAAHMTGGRVVTLPGWVSRHEIGGKPSRPTDFNDMAAITGLEEIKTLLKNAEKPPEKNPSGKKP